MNRIIYSLSAHYKLELKLSFVYFFNHSFGNLKSDVQHWLIEYTNKK